MSKKNVITVRVSEDLKNRIKKISEEQGISMNHFVMYALTKEAGELEASYYFKNYLKDKTKEEIYENFNEAMAAVKENPLPDWDQID